MQMFGVGILELMVILVLAVIVVGPDKLPQVAADLARWIRQTRAYARHLMGDFNDVVAELEKEAGASREDWKEIASLVTRNTGSIGQELNRLNREIEQSGDLSAAKSDTSNVVPIDGTREGTGADSPREGADSEPIEAAGADEEEKPWFVPERTTRRRSRE